MRLPHHLRACFLYISGFPEDYEIRASRLIKLWVAEGILRHDENGCKSLEEEAEECLEDLVKRNLVLVTRRKATGEIKSCSLHDLVRDSCVRIAQQEKFLLHVKSETTKNKRRISSISHYHINEIEIQGPSIHTLLCLRLNEHSSLPAFIGSFRLLRVLDVVCSYMGLLPSQPFELIHLRYLALGTPVEIPAAISNLQNLQTLIINPKGSRFNSNFKSDLPLEIWRMQQLRHLEVPMFCRLLNPIDGSTLPLEKLQNFSGPIVPACCQKILKMMPNLKKLEIHFCIPEGDHDVLDFIHPEQLEKLKLSTYVYSSKMGTHAFPKTLKKLTLVDTSLSLNDIGLLPDLQVLKLENSIFDYKSSDTWETADGELPQLRFLLIQDYRLVEWIIESSHFPRLECLKIRFCPSLQAIPDGFGEISTLELIDVDHVSQSLADSAKQIQETQQDYGNDTLQVRCTHID